MLIAAALALAQPGPFPPPAPGSYGWLGDLSGSCFSSQGGRPGSGRRDCFRMEDGYLVVTRRFSTPGGHNERRCRFEPLGGSLLVRCAGDYPTEETVRLEGDRAIFRTRDQRSRVATRVERLVRTEWRRIDRDRIEIRVYSPIAGLGSPRLVGPVVLTRERARR